MSATNLVPPHGPMGLLRQLWRLDHALGALSRQMLGRLGVTSPQRVALRALVTDPGMSAADLAGHLQVDRSAITGLLRRLEEAGLVERAPDGTDGRKQRITVTDTGRRIDDLREGTVEAALLRTLVALPVSDVEAVRRFLGAFVEEIDRERERIRNLAPRC